MPQELTPLTAFVTFDYMSGGRRGKRRFGHCLLTRLRSEMLEGWVSGSLEN